MGTLNRNPLTGKKLSEERLLTFQLLVRTVVIISLTFLVSMVVAGWLVQQRHRSETMKAISERSRSIGEAIASIMADSVEVKGERAQAFIEGTARDPLFRDLMVVSNDTTIAFAHNRDAVGQRIQLEQEKTCRECHVSGGTLDDRELTYITENGERVLHFVYAIPSAAACRECHDDDGERRGTIVAEVSLAQADASIVQASQRMYLSVLALVIFFIAVAYYLLHKITYKPLETIALQLKRLAAGDFSTVNIDGRRDIIGFIHLQINRTAIRLKDYYEGLERTVAERTKSLRRSQEALSEERDKLQFVFDSSPQGYISISLDGQILFANHKAAAILHEEVGRVIGRPASDFEILRQVVDAGLLRAAEAPPVHQRENVRVIIDKTRHLEVKASLINPQSGDPFILVMLDDVMDKRKLEQHLERHERLASIGRLSAGVAHEVGNPLSAISSLVQITQKMTNPDDIRNNCELIQNHIGRITDIVRNLSTTARGGEQDHVVSEVGEIVRGAVEIAGWDKRSDRVRFDLRESGNAAPLRKPRDRLAQAVLNILLNALDAMQNTDDPILHIGVEHAEDSCVITISDNGHGIAEPELTRIFEPFYSTKPVGTGTGLGLAVTHEAVSRLGGDISVESRPGEGTTFCITLARSESS